MSIQKSSTEKSDIKPATFGDLFTRIQRDSILTPEEEVKLREKVVNKYTMFGLLAKRKEAIDVNTHKELDELLGDMPEKQSILAKLDPFLPGRTPVAPEARKINPNSLILVNDPNEIAKEALQGGKAGIEKIAPEVAIRSVNASLETLKADASKQ